MTPAPAYRDIAIHLGGRVRVERWYVQGDGSLKFGEVVFDSTTPPPPVPAGQVPGPDGRYPADAGPIDMPDPMAGEQAAAGAQDMLPPPMGNDLPHSLPDIGGPGKGQ